jgi:penicillin-binding protein 1A
MKTHNPKFKKFTILFWSLVLTPLLSIFILFWLSSSGKLGYMPPIEDLENPKINLATLIISEDNEVLGSVYSTNQNRTNVEYDRLPKHLVDALVATEDIRYFKHSGIDFKGTIRAFVFLGRRGGGSTITQQLAKLLFHKQARTLPERLKQKIKEYVIAIKLEKSYTKEEIVALYFNQYDFLYSAVGIHSASQIYFNKIPDSLKIEEAAVLVGMAKNAIVYNPKRYPENAFRRRNTVLAQMAKYNYISDSVADSLMLLPVKIDYQPVSHNVGPATYFREHIRYMMTRKEIKRKDYTYYSSFQRDSTLWADDPLFGWCNKNRKPDGKPYDIQVDGLRIYTTINSKLQQYAEEAVRAHIGGYLQKEFSKEKKGRKRGPFSDDLTNKDIDKILKRAIRNSERGRSLRNRGVSMDSIYKVFKDSAEMEIFAWEHDIDTVMTPLDSILYYKTFLNTGFMSMDPKTGHVKAYVGGINFKHFKYDHVSVGKRQAGSTFKPFLYILAMQEGYTPCDEVPVSPVRFKVNDTIWVPQTTCNPKHLGTLKSLKWGLANSENYISAFLVSRFKPQPIADIAYKMGIESHIDPVPSMIYGTSDMSVKEMVAAYATFANKGIHTKPLFVTRIEDKYGNVLATFQPETKEAISEETAFLMLNLMQGVTKFGTAARLRYKYGMNGEIAGKTGTTNKHSDGWFIGITPNLVSGAWVGAEERSIHFDRLGMGSGTSMALPIWGEYMTRVYDDSTLFITEEDVFEAPEGFKVDLDCNKQKEPDNNFDDGSDPFSDFGFGNN